MDVLFVTVVVRGSRFSARMGDGGVKRLGCATSQV